MLPARRSRAKPEQSCCSFCRGGSNRATGAGGTEEIKPRPLTSGSGRYRRRRALVRAAFLAAAVGMHASARSALIEYHELFALFKTPQRRRQRADVHRLGGNVEQVREQPSDLAIEHADELASSRYRDAKQLFGCQTERVFLVHRRDVVEPVEVRQRLQVSFVLNQFFGAAVEQPGMGIDAPAHLT